MNTIIYTSSHPESLTLQQSTASRAWTGTLMRVTITVLGETNSVIPGTVLSHRACADWENLSRSAMAMGSPASARLVAS